jgi:hypothetical protein
LFSEFLGGGRRWVEVAGEAEWFEIRSFFCVLEEEERWVEEKERWVEVAGEICRTVGPRTVPDAEEACL